MMVIKHVYDLWMISIDDIKEYNIFLIIIFHCFVNNMSDQNINSNSIYAVSFLFNIIFFVIIIK